MKRYIQVEQDGRSYYPYYDENGQPVTHATREEAQASVDDDMKEYRQQVADGERTEDEVPLPDKVYECTVNHDGTVILEDGYNTVLNWLD
jgi:hypothetical protein